MKRFVINLEVKICPKCNHLPTYHSNGKCTNCLSNLYKKKDKERLVEAK